MCWRRVVFWWQICICFALEVLIKVLLLSLWIKQLIQGRDAFSVSNFDFDDILLRYTNTTLTDGSQSVHLTRSKERLFIALRRKRKMIGPSGVDLCIDMIETSSLRIQSRQERYLLVWYFIVRL